MKYRVQVMITKIVEVEGNTHEEIREKAIDATGEIVGKPLITFIKRLK